MTDARTSTSTPTPEQVPAPPVSRGQFVLRALAGRRGDWRFTRPRPWRYGLSLASVGPLLVIVTSLIWWWPFANSGSTVSLGLLTGTIAVVLMAWSFVLAVRWRWLEPLFGGLDRMYAVHRWVGVLSMVAMFLHVRVLESEIDGGFNGLLAQFADSATGLASVAEVAFYVLVAMSVLRWVPYRWWRLSHKLLGVPFAFAAFHTVTADKPFGPTSAWSVALAAICVAGVVSWVWRVVGRDAMFPGLAYRIHRTTLHQKTLELELSPVGRSLRHVAGRFAVVKVQLPGLREPHPFTITSAPDEKHLRFFVRDLGDWTAAIQQRDLVGASVRVEGPYGRFAPLPEQGTAQRVVWVAGGVGVTPFLSAAPMLPAQTPVQERPLLVYCVRTAHAATGIEVLRRAAAEGRVNLEVVASAEGRRLDAALFTELVGGDLSDAYVAVCGPAGLVTFVEVTAHELGARRVESEDFNIRSGLGPDLSRPVAAWMDALRERRRAR